LAKSALNFLLAAFLLSGCSSSTSPTYSKDNIATTIEDICKNEYKLDVKAKLVGSTLWIYLPVENMLVRSDEKEKYTEKFEVKDNKAEFSGQALKIDFLIRPIKEKEVSQEYKYNKEVVEKMGNVWKVLRRVVFSLERKHTPEPKFYCLVTADINLGFEIRELIYYLDLKKVSYEFISWGEYQHRSIQDSNADVQIINDREGNHLEYKDFTMPEFITRQIQYRIKLKFSKPEVEGNADIDKEVIKIIAYVLDIYGFRDIEEAQLHNLATNNKISLNRAAIQAQIAD